MPFFQVKAKKNLTDRQKAILYQLNRRMAGSEGSKIRYATLERHKLIGLLKHKEIRPFILIPKHITFEEEVKPPEPEKITIKIKVKLPAITNELVVKFINEHYTNKLTRESYVRAFKNDTHKTDLTHVPEFTTKLLLDTEFFNKLKANVKARFILSPISVFIKEKGYDSRIPLANLRVKIGEALADMKNKDLLKAQHKNTDEPSKVKLFEIKKVYDDMYDAIFTKNNYNYDVFNAAIVAGFYSLNGFRDDLGNVLLTDETTEHNSITNKKFYLREYKTSQKYGTLTYDIPDRLYQIIQKSLEIFPRKFLIINKDNEQQNTFERRFDKNFTRIFEKYLKKTITIQDVRRAWTTEVFENTPEQQEEVARQMGHSLIEALTVYRKIG